MFGLPLLFCRRDNSVFFFLILADLQVYILFFSFAFIQWASLLCVRVRVCVFSFVCLCLFSLSKNLQTKTIFAKHCQLDGLQPVLNLNTVHKAHTPPLKHSISSPLSFTHTQTHTHKHPWLSKGSATISTDLSVCMYTNVFSHITPTFPRGLKTWCLSKAACC